MAHIAKYKAASCGHMLAHYRRDASSLGRENIDPTRPKGNYTLGLDDRDGKVRAMNGIEPNWATVEGIRGAVGRLEVAIADLSRKLAPRSARMTTRALKRDLAALERDYGEDDDRSPKARAAEAQRAARARDANRDDRPPQRSWSQSR